MLKARILTGCVLIGFIFWAIFSFPPAAFVFVVGVLSVAMMREWITLIGLKHRLGRILILDLFIVFEFILYWFLPATGFVLWAAAGFWAAVLPLLIVVQHRQSVPRLNQTLLLFVGYFSLLAFFVGLTTLRLKEQGDLLVLMGFVIVWCSDSFAYLAGRLIGKHKLISAVSPGKTWEGLVGALILTLPALGFYWMKVVGQPFPGTLWALGMVYLILMGVVGDLFESLIKRMHDVKDSGTLLPGHGGLLDRFDSLMAVGPLLALLIAQGVL